MTDQPRIGAAERMFPEPHDWKIAAADRAVCNVRFGTAYRGGRGGDGSKWYEGGGAVGEKAVQPIVIYPPTRGMTTQGDPFEPVKIGILIDMELGQLPGRLDRPGRSWPSRPRERGLLGSRPGGVGRGRRPRAAAGELPEGDQGLRVAVRPGMRRRARADDLRQQHHPAGHRQRPQGGLHRLDRCPQVRQRVLLHGCQRRHPHRRRDVCQLVEGQGPVEDRHVLGGGLVGA